MIRRFFYHLFWNFYDYLGTYLVFGAAFSLSVLLLVTSVGSLGGSVGSNVIRFSLIAAAAIGSWLLLSAALAGFMPFALRAARDHTPRVPELLRYMRENLRRYCWLLLLVSAGAALIGVNVVFYFRMSVAAKGSVAMVGTVLGAVFFWLGFAAFTYATVLVVVAAEKSTLRTLARRAFMAMALAPGLWVATMVTLIGGIALCLLSRVGIVFVLPWFATGAATAYHIVEQHADYLSEAREAIGPDQSVSAYRKKALDLAWQWELRQPRRTLRELIKPWEY
ncbi:MAG: hypothetical protein ACR2IE_19525 [Candidatus Sumerlaeaceae bacterium]